MVVHIIREIQLLEDLAVLEEEVLLEILLLEQAEVEIRQ
jgi:hypothetical protein